MKRESAADSPGGIGDDFMPARKHGQPLPNPLQDMHRRRRILCHSPVVAPVHGLEENAQASVALPANEAPERLPLEPVLAGQSGEFRVRDGRLGLPRSRGHRMVYAL